MSKSAFGTTKEYKMQLPLIVWIVFSATLLALIGGTLFGYSLTGWAWIIPLTFSLLLFARNPFKSSFPFMLWLPWIIVVLSYMLFADSPNAFQRSIMMLCPILVGITASKVAIDENALNRFDEIYRYMAIILSVIVVLKAGILLTGVLPGATGLSGEVMTASLLCTLFVSKYILENNKYLYWWAVLAAIPVIALTRMGMLATALTMPLTLAPMKFAKRLIILCIVILIAIPVFYSERTQKKMFYSGQGTFSDVKFDNPDFQTTGRKGMWHALSVGINKKPWFGHGANASEEFIKRLTGGLVHPHNDWLRLRYDYGYFGTLIFGICMAMQVLHILKRVRYATGKTRILMYAGASSFIIFTLFMFTDNIILYISFFGNIQFTILGLAYASLNKLPDKKKMIRIKW